MYVGIFTVNFIFKNGTESEDEFEFIDETEEDIQESWEAFRDDIIEQFANKTATYVWGNGAIRLKDLSMLTVNDIVIEGTPDLKLDKA